MDVTEVLFVCNWLVALWVIGRRENKMARKAVVDPFSGVEILRAGYRRYVCTVCGEGKVLWCNHESTASEYCTECSQVRSLTFQEE